VEACRLLELALAALPADHPKCAATADRIRARLAELGGGAGGLLLLGGGGGGGGGDGGGGGLGGGLESPGGGGGLVPMTPSSLMLHAHADDDLQVTPGKPGTRRMRRPPPRRPPPRD
jgi:hypothetical protein